jgi:hypothetical protein
LRRCYPSSARHRSSPEGAKPFWHRLSLYDSTMLMGDGAPSPPQKSVPIVPSPQCGGGTVIPDWGNRDLKQGTIRGIS